ncbi:homocysteine S-methyltransferase family protein [Nocardioides campestrisoli]|uniref:homocysteine S-methyltransferase family protein n=1 Tax=Nocardioides campestrisoli TaxID=2736757 RepID=UPI00163DCE00|nr:homocysteine S-methyltransferase family protein [Nocardioides campestrisoli]
MATPLAQLDHRPFVTDGGLETDLLFHHGVTLPDFAAFPLVGDTRGRSLLSDYYDGYAEIARRHDATLLLESPTWRASPDWAGRLGYSPDELDRLNQGAVAVMRGIGAHPTHLARALADGGAWRERVVGVRANASALSHAELDEAEELDEGDPEQFAVDHLALGALLPRLSILGGCCGTDARHVAALWAAPPQVLREATDQAMPSRMSDSETVQE